MDGWNIMLLLSGSNFALGAEMGNCTSRVKNMAKVEGELAHTANNVEARGIVCRLSCLLT